MVLLTLVAAHVYFICPHIHWEPACEAISEVSYFTDPRQKKQRMQENSKKGGMSQDLFVKDAPTLPHLVLMDEVVPLQLFCKSTFT